jgi:uncharacterized membrane protein
VTNSSHKFKRPLTVIVFLLPGLLLLALPFYRPVQVPFLFLFFGRLHPLILHFPIVLIILALLFEIANRYLKIGDGVTRVILIAAAITTLASIGAGFFLFASGDYAGELMKQHFWAGVITGTAVLTTTAFFFLNRTDGRFYPAYLVALLTSNIAVGYTSHLGGSITHGKEYLTEHLTLIMNDLDDKPMKEEPDMLLYDDMIIPIFEAKCLSCHNAQKAKGRLRMDSYQKILLAGESGLPSVTAGSPEKSELYNRVRLPMDHKDHMPPEGKTPLTDDEVSLLEFWIQAGATDTLGVSEAKGEKGIAPIIARVLPELLKYERKASIMELKSKALRADLDEVAKNLNIFIEQDTLSEENLFTIAMKFPPAPFTNDQFRELSPFYEVFSSVSLTSSGIDDAGLYYIGQMVNVKKLYLQKTGLDGSGLVYLQNLPHLEVLNLSFTKIDDKAAIDLLKIPNLKEVYLYRTNTTKQVIDALSKNKPGLKILMEEGPYF